jgi:peroxiredoxin
MPVLQELYIAQWFRPEILPMKKAFRIVQFLANISVIILALVVSASLIRQYFFSGPGEMVPVSSVRTFNNGVPPPPEKRPVIAPTGKTFPLENIEWKEKNLVLYLSTTCRYCKESAGFYQRLVKESAGKGVKLLAVLPQTDEENKSHLESLGVNIGEVYSSGLTSIGVSATPTLLLVDSKGTIVDTWKGKQPEEGENRILDKLLNREPARKL